MVSKREGSSINKNKHFALFHAAYCNLKAQKDYMPSTQLSMV